MNIEELAFKDRKNLAQLTELDLLDIIEFLQEDRNQWINQFTKTHNEGVEIQKENQELREALEIKSYCKYANKCTEFDDCSTEEYETMAIENIKLSIENQGLKEKLDKYENPEDMTLFAMWCTEKVKDENQELKKQLENCYCNRTDCSSRIKDSKKYDSLVQKVETQQKEFIKYLEDGIKELQEIKETELDYDILKDVIPQLLAYKEILQKYKEIIGVSDEKK